MFEDHRYQIVMIVMPDCADIHRRIKILRWSEPEIPGGTDDAG